MVKLFKKTTRIYQSLIIIFLVITLGLGFVASAFLKHSKVDGWSTFYSDIYNIEFQYPPNWNVSYEYLGEKSDAEPIILISPNRIKKPNSIMSGDTGVRPYGIRISPFETYPALPVKITKSDLMNGLEVVKQSISIKTIGTINHKSEPSILVYDMEDGYGYKYGLLVKYVLIGGNVFQIEIGQSFEQPPSSDVADFFSLSETVRTR